MCFTAKCEDGEEYTDCGGCEASCSNQSPLCTRECKPAGCYCKNGYVRENGKCIPVEKCPASEFIHIIKCDSMLIYFHFQPHAMMVKNGMNVVDVKENVDKI